jgi:glycosyltransferase involved in cell wall biosynthesis
MRVLIVSQYFWPETFGINALAGSLKERGVEVTVLTGKPNYPEGSVFKGYSAMGIHKEFYEGMEVLRLPVLPRGQRSSSLLFLNYIAFILAGAICGPLLLRGRSFDVVFVYAPSPLLQALPAIWLAHLKKAPLALWVQDLWPESLSATGAVRNRWVLKLVEWAVRFIYRYTDLILIPSEAFRSPIKELTQGTGDIRYYPNAWIEESFQAEPDGNLEALSRRIASGFSVVFAGNLGAAQSLETVIGAAELLQKSGSEARFFLIGSGSMTGWLTEQIHYKGLRNVETPGRFPSRFMPRLYAAASALLVSLRDEPIFALTIPSKLQGYLAAGKPVIAALNGEGARVVAEAGAGIACAAGSPDALAEAVQSLQFAGPEARDEMGTNARRHAVSHFSLDALTTDLIRHFEELVATHLSQNGKKQR